MSAENERSGERAAVPPADFLAFYDHALPQVYGYLAARCGAGALAEDLTSESFLAAADATRNSSAPTVTVGWMIGVARHKLADHWRREARKERGLRLLESRSAAPPDAWDATIDAVRARQVLDNLGPHHRAALTMRYMDDLPVPEVAVLLGRTVHATEALLVRARAAFRVAYEGGVASDG
ncbi:MAG TPA: sigma-70 family RNA polymerase sigma factor [Acidimicrobiales bacterium]|nr:sigma-70 family RNA polymerase sigma factor [Acidimicrobiales bacterium]